MKGPLLAASYSDVSLASGIGRPNSPSSRSWGVPLGPAMVLIGAALGAVYSCLALGRPKER